MSNRSLFLPDLLPCLGSGRCEFHAKIFGSSKGPRDVPEQWFCEQCQKSHATTIRPDANRTQNRIQSQLELLPAELLLQITQYLPRNSEAALAFASRSLCDKLGTKSWPKPWNDSESWSTWSSLISALARDMPAYASCNECGVIRPYNSACAWPLLKNHHTDRNLPATIHGVSSFLAQKLQDYYVHGKSTGICASLLECSGTYRKPWATHELRAMADIGFPNVEQGLLLNYRARVREKRARNAQVIKFPLASHVQYVIELPKPWSTLLVSERYAVLRGLYLCPHVYASKLQYRDTTDPTYPTDSSVSHWLPDPIPECTRHCSHCFVDFRCRFGSASELHHLIKIDVWKTLNGICGDGFTESVHCPPLNGPLQYGLAKELFETGKPLQNST
ncbi:hypothetical protein CC78DRAFT_530981 [Lojkania enalia]|uniref:F-box domain-containing protein n=1 Tax=Lojkania enalia TaxID=147567 RepID=A0A9P4KEF9_9PLEO|nr:hypothetical protein CC78DRAFT_530981 [Didymosphaeria enalia]